MWKSVFCLALVLMCFSWVYAQESITISTYYPSPYGSYNELQTNRLAIGDTNQDGQLTNADMPNRDGDIRLRPQPITPASWPAGARGQLAYSGSENALYHYNGLNWVGLGTWLPGAVCGAYWREKSASGWHTAVSAPCQGQDVSTGCPTGFTRVGGTFDGSGVNIYKLQVYVCVKN